MKDWKAPNCQRLGAFFGSTFVIAKAVDSAKFVAIRPLVKVFLIKFSDGLEAHPTRKKMWDGLLARPNYFCNLVY